MLPLNKEGGSEREEKETRKDSRIEGNRRLRLCFVSQMIHMGTLEKEGGWDQQGTKRRRMREAADQGEC